MLKHFYQVLKQLDQVLKHLIRGVETPDQVLKQQINFSQLF